MERIGCHVQVRFGVELSGSATALSVSVTCGHMQILHYSTSQYIT